MNPSCKMATFLASKIVEVVVVVLKCLKIRSLKCKIKFI